MTARATLKMTETELTRRHSVRTVTHINNWWVGGWGSILNCTYGIGCAEHKSQAERLAGAAHALHDNASVLRCAECVEKLSEKRKEKSLIDFHTFSKNADPESFRDDVLSSHDNELTS